MKIGPSGQCRPQLIISYYSTVLRVSLSTVLIIGIASIMPIHLKNSSFTFIYESDPTFNILAQFVWSKNPCTQKMVVIVRSLLDLLKKVIFQNSSCCCCRRTLLLFGLDKRISKTKLCMMIGIHDRSCKSIFKQKITRICPRPYIMIETINLV